MEKMEKNKKERLDLSLEICNLMMDHGFSQHMIEQMLMTALASKDRSKTLRREIELLKKEGVTEDDLQELINTICKDGSLLE